MSSLVEYKISHEHSIIALVLFDLGDNICFTVPVQFFSVSSRAKPGRHSHRKLSEVSTHMPFAQTPGNKLHSSNSAQTKRHFLNVENTVTNEKRNTFKEDLMLSTKGLLSKHVQSYCIV
jgi:hypothetical protein